MKKILITGANGFIGKNLTESLRENYEIIPISRKEADLLEESQVKKLFQREDIDVVVHSATQSTLGQGIQAEALRLENNLRMYLNLEKYSDCYGKMLLLGSGAEYNKAQSLSMVSEDFFDNSLPADNYGLSKYMMSKLLAQKDNIYNLRLFGIFGKYENYNYRFISNVICKALEARDIVIRQNAVFDYLYIADFCHILLWFIENVPKEKCYNVCTGQKKEIVSIAEEVLRQTKSESRIQVVTPGLNLEYTGNNERLLKEMGGFSFTSMEQAIGELITYYKNTPYSLEGNY